MKLRIARTREGFALFDDSDVMLPNQRRTEIISAVDQPQIIRVDFTVDDVKVILDVDNRL
jgi:hypothetical protein